MTERNTIPFEEWLEEQLADPEFRTEYEALEPAYQAERLRILREAQVTQDDSPCTHEA